MSRRPKRKAVWSRRSEKQGVGEARPVDEREEHTSVCLVDVHSVKQTDTAQDQGDEAGQHGSGLPRPLAVETPGCPHAMHGTTATMTERAGACVAGSVEQDARSAVAKVRVEGGDSGDTFAAAVCAWLGGSVEGANSHALHPLQ